jgi:hypothetical protein
VGFLGGIKNFFKQTEAAVVVQKLLEHQANKVGWFDLDPAQFANMLVRAAWEEEPDIFSGKFGQRPHKVSTAAIALARAVKAMPKTDSNRSAVLISLGNLLSKIERNGQFYPLNSTDEYLLEFSAKVFMEASADMGVNL